MCPQDHSPLTTQRGNPQFQTFTASGSRAARSGGPRTAAGKRRASLNSLKNGLCPPWVTRDLRARGEDVARFAGLHRELIAWLRPESARTRVMVESLAEAWWEKLRRVRSWVGAGTPDTTEADRRIDDLLQRFVGGWSLPHRKWRSTLDSNFGRRLAGPAALRRALEALLPSLGGKPATKKKIQGRARWRLEGTRPERDRSAAETRNAVQLAADARLPAPIAPPVSDAALVDLLAHLMTLPETPAGHDRPTKQGFGETHPVRAELRALLAELAKAPPKTGG
jgi:hypothetical protein